MRANLQGANEGIHSRTYWNRRRHSRWRAEPEIRRHWLHMRAKDSVTMLGRSHPAKPRARAPSRCGMPVRTRWACEGTHTVGASRASRSEPLCSNGHRSGGVPPLLGRQPRRGSTAAPEENRVQVRSAAGVRPNHSLKLSANGVSRWPSGAGASPHFAPAVQRATPLSPA